MLLQETQPGLYHAQVEGFQFEGDDEGAAVPKKELVGSIAKVLSRNVANNVFSWRSAEI